MVAQAKLKANSRGKAKSTEKRTVSLFRNGRSQAIRIPKEFELPGEEAIIQRVGKRLIVEPAPAKKTKTLKELIDSWDPIGEEFPEIEDYPPDPVEI
jgi:antitoxin VapB